MLDLYITWTIDPVALSVGPLTIRWYGLMFAAGFLLGYYLVSKIFTRENISHDYLDSLLLYIFVGTVLGARFGHVFFWQWDYYSQNLHEIPMIWKGGLASHGAMILIPLILWYYAAKVIKQPALWLLDRIAITVALTGGFIRLGNLMNHEIVGTTATDLPWAFVFTLCEDCGGEPRHPVQLYESLAYFAIFAAMLYLYWKTNAGKFKGLLFGIFLVGVFGVRIIMEFFKRHFTDFELDLMNTIGLNLGQVLSIPAVLVGLYFIFSAKKRPIELPY